MLDNLKDTRLFADIEPERIPSILECLSFRRCSFKKDQLIEDDTRVFLCGVVLSGVVDLVLLRPSGRTVIVRRLQAGSSFMYGITEEKNLSLVAAKNCELLLVNGESVFDPTKKNCMHRRDIMVNMIRMQNEELNYLYYKIALYTERSLRRKILHSFWKDPDCRPDIQPQFDRQEMADYLGCDRSALSRELSRMEKDGLIRLDGRAITYLREPTEEDLED